MDADEPGRVSTSTDRHVAEVWARREVGDVEGVRDALEAVARLSGMTLGIVNCRNQEGDDLVRREDLVRVLRRIEDVAERVLGTGNHAPPLRPVRPRGGSEDGW
jgi:hypothetical protein